MKKYLFILVASLGLAGCAHHQDYGGTSSQSDTYRGGMGTPSDWNTGSYNSDTYNNTPSGALRTPGANEHSPPPVSPSPSTDQDFAR
jgi:Prokaryotic membrane lipoprotein lipid attachment site